MLRAEHLKIRDMPALSFSVRDGQCLAIQGPSGSGKTSILRALADLDPSAGHVFLDGAERCEMAAHTWRRSVRYVAAEPGWWGDTARAAFALDDAPSSAKLANLLDSVGLDAALLDQPLMQASTGERQRLALVRALIDGPRVLLLDEPTGALDTATAALVEELLRYQKLSGRILILVSHNAEQVRRLADARLQLGVVDKPAAQPRTAAFP